MNLYRESVDNPRIERAELSLSATEHCISDAKHHELELYSSEWIVGEPFSFVLPYGTDDDFDAHKPFNVPLLLTLKEREYDKAYADYFSDSECTAPNDVPTDSPVTVVQEDDSDNNSNHAHNSTTTDTFEQANSAPKATFTTITTTTSTSINIINNTNTVDSDNITTTIINNASPPPIMNGVEKTNHVNIGNMDNNYLTQEDFVSRLSASLEETAATDKDFVVNSTYPILTPLYNEERHPIYSTSYPREQFSPPTTQSTPLNDFHIL